MRVMRCKGRECAFKVCLCVDTQMHDHAFRFICTHLCAGHMQACDAADIHVCIEGIANAARLM